MLTLIVDSVMILTICIISFIYSHQLKKSKRREKLKDAQIETLEETIEFLQNKEKR